MAFKWLRYAGMTKIEWAVILFIVMFLGFLSGGSFFLLLDIPLQLAFGWILFLRDSIATIEVNPLLCAEAVVCIVLLGVGGHGFARWLYREMAPEVPSAWRPNWTVVGLSGVLLLFIASIAIIGAIHQAIWLFTKGPMASMDSRMQVGEALAMSAKARAAVWETFAKTRQLPSSSVEAGYTESTPETSPVRLISIIPGGEVQIDVVIDDGSGIITLTPIPADNKLDFKCRSTLPRKKLPPNCSSNYNEHSGNADPLVRNSLIKLLF